MHKGPLAIAACTDLKRGIRVPMADSMELWISGLSGDTVMIPARHDWMPKDLASSIVCGETGVDEGARGDHCDLL